MCQLQEKEYARAMATIRRCPQNGAPTHYVAFLIAVRQGLYAALTVSVACWSLTGYSGLEDDGNPDLYPCCVP